MFLFCVRPGPGIGTYPHTYAYNFIFTFDERTGPDTAGDRSWTVILLLQQQKRAIDHKSIFPKHKNGIVSSHSKTDG